jgi:hypothetical protein
MAGKYDLFMWSSRERNNKNQCNSMPHVSQLNRPELAGFYAFYS